MSLIVNGTTVKKVIVVKDSVSTNLTKLIVNGTVVFQTLPPPVDIKSFDQNLHGDIVSYGDIGENTHNPYDGITTEIGTHSAILLTKYVANNGHPYQTMRRAYIGNTEEGLPNFMADDGYLEIMSTLGGFKHIYLPVDYYGPENPLPTINAEPIHCVPIMSSALAYIGASPVIVSELPHYSDFDPDRPLLPIETGTYSNGKKNIFMFAETAEMRAFKNAHPDDLPEPFIGDSTTEMSNSYLLFQPYDSAETIEDLIRYYFGEYFSNTILGSLHYGDIDSFYANSGLEHALSNSNIIVMDSINSWATYFENTTIGWNPGNPFYDCANTLREEGEYGYLGPWASPAAQWPETNNNAQPALLMDKIPRGFDIGIYPNMLYPVLFGPQALAEALIMDLIPSNEISIEASANIDNLKEVYEAFETDPIDTGISGITLNLDLYSHNIVSIPGSFVVGTKTI